MSEDPSTSSASAAPMRRDRSPTRLAAEGRTDRGVVAGDRGGREDPQGGSRPPGKEEHLHARRDAVWLTRPELL